MLLKIIVFFLAVLISLHHAFALYENDNHLGVGHATELPISSLTLFMSEPKVINNEARNLPTEMRKEDEDTGEGTVQLVPVNSIKVRFNPPIQRQKPNSPMTSGQKICEEKCKMPSLPRKMAEAAKNCNSESENLGSLSQRNREGRPELRRISTTHRALCSSHCVLTRLHLLEENGLPNADRVTGFFLEHFGFKWTSALRTANLVCSKAIENLALSDFHFRDDKVKFCEISVTFMKCLHETLEKNCPESFLAPDCEQV
ncbi:uncharacterized protein LOC132204564 [Neocloeon triangulifer]|uniref:uncharacterized protein LOC132204564 n=1 Tax=Neocloeon triangulifer TaxID=2078957 RepID=UPI00286ED936|nr:uncharacterized protein LOC132204564 [Neocloeon triangulifer]